MEKVKVAFDNNGDAYLIPEVLTDKFYDLIVKKEDAEFNKTFEDYKYKRGEFDLYIEAKGIYSKYNTENALK